MTATAGRIGGANIADLLGRGDEFAGSDDRAAMAFYQAALKTAQATPIGDPQMIERLRNAQAFIEGRVQPFPAIARPVVGRPRTTPIRSRACA